VTIYFVEKSLFSSQIFANFLLFLPVYKEVERKDVGMKQAFPNLLKIIGALALTTAIFFLLSPEEKIDDTVLNASMEFLGSKLLAMVPQDQKPHVQKEFEAFREQTQKGEVSDKHFEGVAIAILNAEAEGRQLERHEIDSLLTSIRQAETAKAEDEAKRREELIALSERVQAFQEFEHQWKKIVPPPADSTGPPALPPRPLYRIASNFVIEIDTMAIAEVAAAHAEHYTALAPKVMVMPTREVFRELARELPALKFEMRKIKLQTKMADSLRGVFEQNFAFEHQMRRAMVQVQAADSVQKVFVQSPEYQRQMHEAMVQVRVADSLAKAFTQNPKYQQQMRRAILNAQRADSIRKAMEQYHREHPDKPLPALPPMPPEVEKPEKPKPP
jgi:hypothetical protein